jgi:hypothetical protein
LRSKRRIKSYFINQFCFFFQNSVLSVSLSFDVKLPNGQSTRHPDANRFIDTIRERLHQAIEIYETKPLGKISVRMRIRNILNLFSFYSEYLGTKGRN